MRVGILIAFAGRNCGGPENYERDLVRSLHQQQPDLEYHLYCLDRRAPSVLGVSAPNVVYHVLAPSVRAVAMMTSLPAALRRTKPGVFHAPIMMPPFVPPRTLMAMACSSLIRHPEFYPPLIRMRIRFLLHRAVPKAAKVICPSEHVREVMQERFGLPEDKLPVVQLGVNPIFQRIDEETNRTVLREKYGLTRPYFLFSGRWEARKNIIRTLQAFAVFKNRYPSDHMFVLTGGRSWASAEAERFIHRLGITDSVIDLGKTPYDELPYLYGGAEALLYASLWEGFGMPITEAMACGTPVITSNLAAMPETAGGAALLVDPYSVEEIADAMDRIASDASLRKRLSRLGLDRARVFKWEHAARKTLELYHEVAESDAMAAGATYASL